MGALARGCCSVPGAVTAHAEAAGVNRYELEMAVKLAVLHPEPEGD